MSTPNLPETVKLKAKWPLELICNNQRYTLLEHEFWTAWPDDPTMSRGPYYVKADEPRSADNPLVYMPCIEFLEKLEPVPSAMHAVSDAPTELDEPLRAYSAALE